MTTATMTNGVTLAKTRIAYNRETKDYDLFVAIDDGAEQYIGSAANHHDGQARIDAYVFDFYADNHTPEAAAAVVMHPEEVIETSQPGGSGGGDGRVELAFCEVCGAPGTTTDPDADYICPDCLATRAGTGAPQSAIAAEFAAP